MKNKFMKRLAAFGLSAVVVGGMFNTTAYATQKPDLSDEVYMVTADCTDPEEGNAQAIQNTTVGTILFAADVTDWVTGGGGNAANTILDDTDLCPLRETAKNIG